MIRRLMIRINLFRTMNLTSVVLGILILNAPTTHGRIESYSHPKRPHWDLDISGTELSNQLQNSFSTFGFDHRPLIQHQDPLYEIFRLGKRNLDWIQLLNETREHKISLTSPTTQMGYPITQPSSYNEKIILESLQNFKAYIKDPLKSILIGTAPLPPNLPSEVDETSYIQWGLALDRIYQLALRWKSYQPYLDELRADSYKDLRGYYYLSSHPQITEKLRNWNALSESEKTNYKTWLIQVCRNDLMNNEACLKELGVAMESNAVLDYFQRYQRAGQRLWQEMMEIPRNSRFSQLQWKNQTTAEIPFEDPMNQSIRGYLSENIQEEWRFPPKFSIHLFFVDQFADAVKVIWEPGVTPYVPSLGSNIIYMDSNAPISEYDVRWTIRHEFGHILGFPDCYLEFYDDAEKAIVGYQLDTSDLMCSRRGRLKNRHVVELRRKYPGSI